MKSVQEIAQIASVFSALEVFSPGMGDMGPTVQAARWWFAEALVKEWNSRFGQPGQPAGSGQ